MTAPVVEHWVTDLKRGGNPHHTDRPNQPYERQGIHRIIKRVLRRVDLDKVTRPHVLRATRAQLLIEAGASMALVSQHLGQATIRTTEEYYVGSVTTSRLAKFDGAFGEEAVQRHGNQTT